MYLQDKFIQEFVRFASNKGVKIRGVEKWLFSSNKLRISETLQDRINDATGH